MTEPLVHRSEQENIRQYSPDAPGPPVGFSSCDVGESWEDAA